jgi:hypothetical protein
VSGRVRTIVWLVLCSLAGTVQADDRAMLARAIDGAAEQFEAARPGLDRQLFGVDVEAYRDALYRQQFRGGAWQGETQLNLELRAQSSGSCGRFAAFVRIPPQDGVVDLVLCPEFFSPGADGLRTLTVLHEMVHVVAGRDECQAMAFAARIEQLASGSFTAVDAYWRAQDCAASGYRLP